METVTLSFPGLGIDEFTINKILLSIGDTISIRWYALCLVTGIIAAYIYSCRRARDNGLTADDMTDVALWTIIAGVIGARVYYVLSKLDSYDSFWDMCKIWEGGIAVYGSLIGGGLALFICCKVKKISWRAVFDTVAPGVLIAQGIGRWGNFFNGEAYGAAPAEDSILYFLRMTVRQGSSGTTVLAQPCFFYESLWCVLGFILINVFYKKKKYDGQIFFEYVLWYSFGRMFIEGLRTDSLYLFDNESLPRKSQALALLLVIASAVCLLVFGLSVRKKNRIAAAEAGEGGAYADMLKDSETPEETSAEPDTAEETAGDSSADETPSETAGDSPTDQVKAAEPEADENSSVNNAEASLNNNENNAEAETEGKSEDGTDN